jgi:hypothetical protein
MQRPDVRNWVSWAWVEFNLFASAQLPGKKWYQLDIPYAVANSNINSSVGFLDVVTSA